MLEGKIIPSAVIDETAKPADRMNGFSHCLCIANIGLPIWVRKLVNDAREVMYEVACSAEANAKKTTHQGLCPHVSKTHYDCPLAQEPEVRMVSCTSYRVAPDQFVPGTIIKSSGEA